MDSMDNENTYKRNASAKSMGNEDTPRNDQPVLGRIDRYEILKELGGGGFGCVYLARDTVSQVEVAVKGLPPLIQHNAEELERIRENFALVSKLHHPNIAPALHLHKADSVHYADQQTERGLRVGRGDYLMVMAYAPGVTLSQWRKQFPNGKVPVEKALEVCGQVADALDYAHEQKIVHRDVKPSNIMVETRKDGSVVCRVLDFGLAAEIRSSMSRVSRETGDTSGTRPYMAPEQWAGKRQDGRTDQYSLAVLFYELVGGSVPFVSAFETGDPVIMSNAAENKTPDPLLELDFSMNETLLMALAKHRDERFGSCEEFIERLSHPNDDNKRAGNGGWIAVTVVGLLILGWIVRIIDLDNAKLSNKNQQSPGQTHTGPVVKEKETGHYENDINEEAGKSDLKNNTDSRDLEITLDTLSGRRVFHADESPVFTVKANRDCYLAVVAEMASGKYLALFPSVVYPDPFVKAGTVVRFPANDSASGGFRFVISPPFGEETIRAVASTAEGALQRFIKGRIGGGKERNPVIVPRDIVIESTAKKMGQGDKEFMKRAKTAESVLRIETKPKG